MKPVSSSGVSVCDCEWVCVTQFLVQTQSFIISHEPSMASLKAHVCVCVRQWATNNNQSLVNLSSLPQAAQWVMSHRYHRQMAPLIFKPLLFWWADCVWDPISSKELCGPLISNGTTIPWRHGLVLVSLMCLSVCSAHTHTYFLRLPIIWWTAGWLRFIHLCVASDEISQPGYWYGRQRKGWGVALCVCVGSRFNGALKMTISVCHTYTQSINTDNTLYVYYMQVDNLVCLSILCYTMLHTLKDARTLASFLVKIDE